MGRIFTTFILSFIHVINGTLCHREIIDYEFNEDFSWAYIKKLQN